MMESEYDCCESDDDDDDEVNPNNKSQIDSNQFLKNQNLTKNLDVVNCPIITLNSASESNINERVNEVEIDTQNISNISVKDSLQNESKSVENLDKIVDGNSFDENPNNRMMSKSSESLINSVSKTIKKQILDDNNKNECDLHVEESSIKLRNRLSKTKAVDHGSNYSYSGVSDRIKVLNKQSSLDSNYDQKSEKSNLPETKKLAINPDFEQKMKGICYPISTTSFSYSNSDSSNIQKPNRLTLKIMHSNSEVIEENISPVSKTAKQLEQQLSFPSNSVSPAMSPRLPKLTRFARLNRFLSATSEPEESSPTESNESMLLNS